MFSISAWYLGFGIRYEKMYSGLILTQQFLMITVEASYSCVMGLTALSTGFWNMKNWKDFLQTAMEIEDFLKIKEPLPWYKNTRYRFWAFTAIFLVTMVSNFIIHFKEMFGIFNIIISIFTIFINCYGFVMQMSLMNMITINLRYKFKKISKCLALVCHKEMRWTQDQFSFDVQIRNLAKMTRKTFHLIKLQNHIYGWQTLGSTIATSCVLLTGLNFVTLYFSSVKRSDEFSNNLQMLVVFLLTALFFSVSIKQ